MNKVDLAYNSYSYLSLFIFSSLCGTYSIIYVCKSIKYKWRIIEYIGKNTLIIMALHFLAFKLISLIIILVYGLSMDKINDYPTIKEYHYWWILYSFVGISIPLLLGYSFRKLKIVLKNILTN
jgi:fucose 4-O-acetylase-like acetyltransferase